MCNLIASFEISKVFPLFFSFRSFVQIHSTGNYDARTRWIAKFNLISFLFWSMQWIKVWMAFYHKMSFDKIWLYMKFCVSFYVDYYLHLISKWFGSAFNTAKYWHLMFVFMFMWPDRGHTTVTLHRNVCTILCTTTSQVVFRILLTFSIVISDGIK